MSKYESYLRQNLSKYRYPDQAKTDIIQALAAYNDLRPEVQPFTFNDGVTRQMMSLNGTLPVNYQGTCYNIPICVFVLDTHPYNPPMVFVRPTSTMQIKQGRHVDSNGKIYLPYLSDWNPQSKSSLEGLLGILQIIFSEQPPVFSKPLPGTTPSPSFPRMPAPGLGGIAGATQPPYPYPAPALQHCEDIAKQLEDAQRQNQLYSAMLQEAGVRFSNLSSTELCDSSGSWWWALESGRVFDLDTNTTIPGSTVSEVFTELARGNDGCICGPDVILPVSLGGVKLASHFGKSELDNTWAVWFTVSNDEYNTKTVKVKFPLRFRVSVQLCTPKTKQPLGNALSMDMTLTEIGEIPSHSKLYVNDVDLADSSRPPLIRVIFTLS